MADVLMHDVVMSDSTELTTSSTRDLNAITIQLSAMGRDLLLELEPSRFNKLTEQHNLAAETPSRLYQGTVAGDPTSWVRISLYDGTLSGYIYHFDKLLQLESRAYANATFNPDSSNLNSEHISSDNITSDNSKTDNSESRASDFVLIEPGSYADAQPMLENFFGNTDQLTFAPYYALSDEPAFTHDKIKRSAIARKDALGTGVTRAIRIGIVVDSRFDEAHRYRGLARALSIINSADAIFQSQLGIAIIVEGIRVYDDPATDPMRNNGESVSELLDNFRNVRIADERLPNDLTLVHLFSGHRDPNRMIGLGWISTACRLDGYDISLSTQFPFDTLLAAHEIAHNMGALHDDDPQCHIDANRQANTIMWPEITGSSGSTFSACSTRDIQDSKYASCNVDNIDVSVRLRTYPTNDSLRRSVVIEVKNKDKYGRSTELASKTTFPLDTQFSDISAGCRVEGAVVDCDHGILPPGANGHATVTATLTSSSLENVISEVELLNASDIKTQDNRAAIRLLEFDDSTGEAVAATSQLVIFEDSNVLTPPDNTEPRIGSPSLLLLALLLQLIRLRRIRVNRCA